jgi:hypothetical protein
MKPIVAIALIIIAVLLTSVVWYMLIVANQNANLSSNPLPTPKLNSTSTPSPSAIPPATVKANIIATPTLLSPTTSAGEILVINGTVTNNSPNTAYNVGLNVTAFGTFSIIPSQEVMNIVVPISSGTYGSGIIYPLSTLTPYQSVPINITIMPILASHEPTLNGVTVTLVWSNAP